MGDLSHTNRSWVILPTACSRWLRDASYLTLLTESPFPVVRPRGREKRNTDTVEALSQRVLRAMLQTHLVASLGAGKSSCWESENKIRPGCQRGHPNSGESWVKPPAGYLASSCVLVTMGNCEGPCTDTVYWVRRQAELRKEGGGLHDRESQKQHQVHISTFRKNKPPTVQSPV